MITPPSPADFEAEKAALAQLWSRKIFWSPRSYDTDPITRTWLSGKPVGGVAGVDVDVDVSDGQARRAGRSDTHDKD